MHDGRNGCHINPPVQLLPCRRSKPPDHGGIGCSCKRNEDRKGDHSEGDIGAFENVREDFRAIEAAVEDNVAEKMSERVKEGEKTECPPEANEIGASQSAQRGDRKPSYDEAKRPNAQLVLKRLYRIGTKLIVQRKPKDPDSRNCAA